MLWKIRCLLCIHKWILLYSSIKCWKGLYIIWRFFKVYGFPSLYLHHKSKWSNAMYCNYCCLIKCTFDLIQHSNSFCHIRCVNLQLVVHGCSPTCKYNLNTTCSHAKLILTWLCIDSYTSGHSNDPLYITHSCIPYMRNKHRWS